MKLSLMFIAGKGPGLRRFWLVQPRWMGMDVKAGAELNMAHVSKIDSSARSDQNYSSQDEEKEPSDSSL